MVDKKEKIKDIISFPNNPEFLKKIKKAEKEYKAGNFITLTPEYKKKLFGK